MLEHEANLAPIVAAHHGVFTREHARQAGCTTREIDRRLTAGVWTEVQRGVLRVAATPLSWKGSLLAACWAGGFRAYVSHRSAAALWSLAGGREDIVEITCPRWRRARHHPLVVHETKAFHHVDITMVDRIPVTLPARTLVDLGAVCSPATVEMAVDRAVHTGLTSRAEIARVLRRVGRSGRNGAGVLRSIMRQRGATVGKPESEMETYLLQVLRRSGLPTPELQYEIRHEGVLVARADAAYPQWRIAIEYDSDEFHASVMRRRRDSDRRNHVGRVGWVQVTAHRDDLKSGGRELVRTINVYRHRFGVT